jgi:hypothetical protein
MSVKTTGAAPAGGAAAVAGAAFCKAVICAWSMVMMAMSLALVGATLVMFAWHLVVATMIVSGVSYWELSWYNESCGGRCFWVIRSKICWLN